MQGSFIYFQQVKELGDSYEALLPQGKINYCLYTLFDQLQVDFFFVDGFFHLIEFLSDHPINSFIYKILCYTSFFKKLYFIDLLLQLSKLFPLSPLHLAPSYPSGNP